MSERRKKFHKHEIVGKLADYFSSKPEIQLAYLFGSVAEDTQNRLSDVDVAILADPEELAELEKEPFGYQVSLVTELMSLLHTNDVDVAILNYATPLLAHEVVQNGELIFCRDDDHRVEFEIRAKHRYLDTKPLRDIKMAYFQERVKKGLIGKRGANGNPERHRYRRAYSYCGSQERLERLHRSHR